MLVSISHKLKNIHIKWFMSSDCSKISISLAVRYLKTYCHLAVTSLHEHCQLDVKVQHIFCTSAVTVLIAYCQLVVIKPILQKQPLC